MSKREREGDQDDRPPKRARPAKTVQVDRPVEQIQSARQLQQLLSFQQDDIQHLRHGISSCKAFLEGIVYQAQDDIQSERLAILREYLEHEKPRDVNETDRPFFAQLWQAWSFANSNNSDHLSSAICSLFALLLKSLSTLVDFREYGRLLCRTVLQFQHLRLIKRCLDAPKHKEFLLSPSLRLLSEVTNFDGGSFSHEVYKRREQTFDLFALRKCLTIVKAEGSEDDIIRRPAVRTLAVRYILTHLRLQDEGGKIDILKQKIVCSTLFSYFRSDPPELILETLRTTEINVFKYAELPRAAKAALLTQQHLDRVLDIATRAEVNEEVTTEALRWLKAACSTPSYGILRRSGWYPPGTMHLDDNSVVDDGAIDLGLESLDFWENDEKYQIKNVVLAAWIHTLRPNSDLRERELILTCFKSAPELVHAYFRDNALQMDPKLTNTWIGYASFMFEVANLPVAAHAGNVDSSTYAVLPPQTNIVLNNILPRPLTQKILTRCLNQNDKLISFFVLRILNVALDKIRRLREEYHEAALLSSQATLWQEAAVALEIAILRVIPPLKDVLILYRKFPDNGEHALQREAATRLLRLYLTVLPTTHDDSLDVSSALMTALSRDNGDESVVLGLNDLELEHLIVIAQRSADMRWFQRHGSFSRSPIAMMLKIAVQRDNRPLRDLTSEVLYSSGVLSKEQPRAFDALCWSMESVQNEDAWTFLDDCFSRANKAPVKYLDEIDRLDSSGTTSLLPAVILEQAPFVVTKPSEAKTAVMRWVNSLFSYWLLASGNADIIRVILAQIHAIQGWDAKDGSKVKLKSAGLVEEAESNHDVNNTPLQLKDKLSAFTLPPSETPDHPELFRWQRKELDQAFEDHDVDDLVLCLCSSYVEVRRQALSQIQNLMVKLQASDLDDKEQLYLVLGELVESYIQNYQQDDQALPYLVGTFATHALHVQMDPTHHIYPKLNQFLMKSPEWRVNKLPSHWLAACSMAMPSEDDSYWKEIQWTLDWLVDGLRGPTDLELLRKAGSIERLMVLYASPSASEKLVKQRVLEILDRAALIDSMTLITRAGVLSWLSLQKGGLSVALRQFILDQSDAGRLQTWSGCEILHE